MSALLDIAIEQVRPLSAERQEEIAKAILDMREDVYILTPEEEASFAAALDDVKNGRFATDEEIEAIWAKYSA